MRCRRCKNEAKPGNAACEYHLAKELERVKARRAKKVAAGLCVWASCQEKAHGGNRYCEGHRVRALAVVKKCQKARWRVGLRIPRIVGVREEKAREKLEADAWKLRVVKRDGEAVVVTRDVDTSRINVEVEKGLVSRVVSRG